MRSRSQEPCCSSWPSSLERPFWPVADPKPPPPSLRKSQPLPSRALRREEPTPPAYAGREDSREAYAKNCLPRLLMARIQTAVTEKITIAI